MRSGTATWFFNRYGKHGVVQIFVLQTYLMYLYVRFIGSDSVYLTEFPVIGARDHASRAKIAEAHGTRQAHDMHVLHHSTMAAGCSRRT